MRGRSLIPALGTMTLCAFVTPVKADDQLRLSIDGSLPLAYTDNALRERDDRREAYMFSPFLQVSALGQLGDGMTYRLFANTSGDKSLTKYASDADGAQTSFGAVVSKSWGAFSLHGGVERNNYFNLEYEEEDSPVVDTSIAARYNYISPDRKWRIRPSITFTARLEDTSTFSRYVTNAKVDFEYRLAEKWWAMLTPRVRIYDYISGDKLGRHDVLSSISGGIRYVFTPDVSLSTYVAYEHRDSNRPDKTFHNLTIGTSLDFSFDLTGSDTKTEPRWEERRHARVR